MPVNMTQVGFLSPSNSKENVKKFIDSDKVFVKFKFTTNYYKVNNLLVIIDLGENTNK